MSIKDSAFVSVSTKCPICERVSRHRYVKSKLYTPVTIEGDQHVIDYKWGSPRFEGIRPNFYYIWHCSHCHFCDEKEVFRGKDNSGGKLELIREKILIAAKAPNSLLVRMGQVIDLEKDYIALESALAAHLQAVYIQGMLSPNMRQYGKLGRLYLRTGWLYREKKSWSVPETEIPPGFKSYDDFFISLLDEWPELPLTEEAATDKAISHYENELDRSKGMEDVRHELGIVFLLIDLYTRLDRSGQALKYIQLAFSQATQKRQQVRQKLDIGIRRGKLTQKQIEPMQNLISWLNNGIERITDISETLSNQIFEREYSPAREKVLQMPKPTVKRIIQHLQDEGFHEVTCRRIAAMFSKKLLESNAESGLAQDAERMDKKRGFWSNLLEKILSEDE